MLYIIIYHLLDLISAYLRKQSYQSYRFRLVFFSPATASALETRRKRGVSMGSKRPRPGARRICNTIVWLKISQDHGKSQSSKWMIMQNDVSKSVVTNSSFHDLREIWQSHSPKHPSWCEVLDVVVCGHLGLRHRRRKIGWPFLIGSSWRECVEQCWMWSSKLQTLNPNPKKPDHRS